MTGTDEQTQCVLNSGALQMLPGLLRHDKPNIQKEAAWTVSNITAGKDTQIREVIDAGLIPILVEILQQVRTQDLRTEGQYRWCFGFGGVGIINYRIICFLFSDREHCLLFTQAYYNYSTINTHKGTSGPHS